MRRNIVGLLASALMCVCGVAQANIVYNVNITDGLDTVTGTITTDGATGLLAASDFVSWSLSVSGVVSFLDVGPPPAPVCGVAGCGIEVVGGTLVFNGTTSTFLDLMDLAGDGVAFSQGFVFLACAGAVCEHIFLPDIYTVGRASVPEPTTAILLGLGLACLGFARRKR